MHKPGTNKYTRYDAVMAYLKTKDEWLSTENAQTIKYKVKAHNCTYLYNI
jgi:hypothetical protein